jgi:hypothetical protein
MSASELAAHSAPTDAWTVQLEQLRARYRHVRPPILAALNILILDPSISIEDAKARAALHGVRITAASMASARTLFSRMDSQTLPAAATNAGPVTNTVASTKRETRRARQTDAGIDAEALVRGFVAKLQTQGNAETERLREAMRKAVAVLQAALGSS